MNKCNQEINKGPDDKDPTKGRLLLGEVCDASVSQEQNK